MTKRNSPQANIGHEFRLITEVADTGRRRAKSSWKYSRCWVMGPRAHSVRDLRFQPCISESASVPCLHAFYLNPEGLPVADKCLAGASNSFNRRGAAFNLSTRKVNLTRYFFTPSESEKSNNSNEIRESGLLQAVVLEHKAMFDTKCCSIASSEHLWSGTLLSTIGSRAAQLSHFSVHANLDYINLGNFYLDYIIFLAYSWTL